MINVPFTTQPVYALSLLTTISIKKVLWNLHIDLSPI
jgi:hypothetical protein